jgi:hypothetical protein
VKIFIVGRLRQPLSAPSQAEGWRRRANLGCGQCPHFGSRTGSYVGRFGPDSACFRGSPGFAGAGMQFESHLGHSMTPRQRGFCFNVWTLTFRGSL